MDKRMILNEYGEVIYREWFLSFMMRKEIISDRFAIMPNHIHGIIRIVGVNGGLPTKEIKGRANCHSPLPMKPRSLSSFIAGFKSVVSRKIGFPVWQRNFYDHIIRNKRELNKIRQYIDGNPNNWEKDLDNPVNLMQG